MCSTYRKITNLNQERLTWIKPNQLFSVENITKSRPGLSPNSYKESISFNQLASNVFQKIKFTISYFGISRNWILCIFVTLNRCGI